MILLDICQLYIYVYKFNGGLGKICYKFIFESLKSCGEKGYVVKLSFMAIEIYTSVSSNDEIYTLGSP
jgi:hypothetical protein